MRLSIGTVMAAGVVGGAMVMPAAAAQVQVRVTTQNLAPSNSVTVSALSVGFHSGVYDPFDAGQASSFATQRIAEAGSGEQFFPALAAADPSAVSGVVSFETPMPLQPGLSNTAVFTIDTETNAYFTFGAMVVPSNDYFIGNDSATEYKLFDEMGNLQITSISQFGRDVWDSGTEVDGLFGSAFIAGQSGGDRIDQNGVVNFDQVSFDRYQGLTTAAGYTFDRQFGADDEIYRISFELVPAPSAAAGLGLAGLIGMGRRRR